jgi:hypothetical protein
VPVTQDATMKEDGEAADAGVRTAANAATGNRHLFLRVVASSAVGAGSQHCSGKLKLNRNPLPRSDGLEVPVCGHPRGTRVVAADEEGRQ